MRAIFSHFRPAAGLSRRSYNGAIGIDLHHVVERQQGRLPSPGARCIMVGVKGIFMEKWLCFGSMGVAGLLLLLFLLDIALGFPFGRTIVVDVFGILVSGLVLYLAYDAFKDLS